VTPPVRPDARCCDLIEVLSRYLDGDLTPARRRDIDRHIDTCVGCRRMAAEARRTLAACRAEGKRRPPRDVIARATERVRALMLKSVP
jgi:anti-sigma factor RsiW